MKNVSVRIFQRIIISLILFLFSFLFQTTGQAVEKDKLYDAVIIGGGPSGLAAAYDLKGFDTVILEKDDHLGGRILTREKNGVSYDLGAAFRYTYLTSLPPESDIPAYFVEKGDIAMSYKGKIYYCDNVMSCIDQLGLDPGEVEKVNDFKNSQCSEGLLASYGFSEDSYGILNSLFRVIHSGEMCDYTCERQKDLFRVWDIEYYSEGNRFVIDSFKKALSSRIELNAEVLSVKDCGKYVVTVYRQRGRINKIFSKTAIVTVPAPVAKKILRRMGPECSLFLDSVRYGKFIVVVVGLKDANLGNFRYFLTLDALSIAIVPKRLEDKKITVFYIYYGDKGSRQLSGDPDARIIDSSIDIIRKTGAASFTADDIVFTDIKRWEYGGTIVSSLMLRGALSKGYSRPSKRVFLAGDYVCMDYSFPYGMMPAVASGKQTASKVADFLK